MKFMIFEKKTKGEKKIFCFLIAGTGSNRMYYLFRLETATPKNLK